MNDLCIGAPSLQAVRGRSARWRRACLRRALNDYSASGYRKTSFKSPLEGGSYIVATRRIGGGQAGEINASEMLASLRKSRYEASSVKDDVPVAFSAMTVDRPFSRNARSLQRCQRSSCRPPPTITRRRGIPAHRDPRRQPGVFRRTAVCSGATVLVTHDSEIFDLSKMAFLPVEVADEISTTTPLSARTQ